jgi:hypothetical protein
MATLTPQPAHRHRPARAQRDDGTRAVPLRPRSPSPVASERSVASKEQLNPKLQMQGGKHSAFRSIKDAERC